MQIQSSLISNSSISTYLSSVQSHKLSTKLDDLFDKHGADIAVLIGSKELESDTCIIRTKQWDQQTISISSLDDHIKTLINL